MALIFSNRFEEHLSHLEEIFQLLEVAGLRLRKDKCGLAYRGVEFLGHFISENGRSPLASYTRRVQSFPRPNCVKELQRYLGMANYYRCYIKNFSVVAEPLSALTRTGCKWHWDEQCVRAFDDLRHRLLKEPSYSLILVGNRSFTLKQTLATPGSELLGQIDERTGKVRPIEFPLPSARVSATTQRVN